MLAAGCFKEAKNAKYDLQGIAEDEAYSVLTKHFLDLDSVDEIKSAVCAHHGYDDVGQIQESDYHAAFPKGAYEDFEQAVVVANGTATPFLKYWPKWEKIRRAQVKPKTVDMETSSVTNFAAATKSIQALEKQNVQDWINRRLSAHTSPTTVRRQISGFRAYWKFLKSQGVQAPKEVFEDLDYASANISGKAGEFAHASPDLALRVWKAATENDSRELADFILIGLYSGMRRGEIAALDLDTTTADLFKVKDAKTKAGIREIPVHSALKHMVERRLKLAQRDPKLKGYLFSRGETKYKTSGNIFTNRFATARNNAGIATGEIILHSLRKVFTTALSRTGANLEEVASIVGHETNQITYDIYSRGPTVGRKRELIEKVKYSQLFRYQQ